MDGARTKFGKDSIFHLEVIENGLVVHRAGDNHVRAVRRALTACFAPCSTSGCIFENVRFQTVKSKPALNMHWAMLEPILPKPMIATFMVVPRHNGSCDILLCDTRHQGLCGAHYSSRVDFAPLADMSLCAAHVCL